MFDKMSTIKEEIKNIIKRGTVMEEDGVLTHAYLTEYDINNIYNLLQELPDRNTEVVSNRISHPSYYRLPNGVECKDVIQYFDFNTGSAIKYCWRNGKKSEAGMTLNEKAIEDLGKAIECLQFEIELLTSQNNHGEACCNEL